MRDRCTAALLAASMFGLAASLSSLEGCASVSEVSRVSKSPQEEIWDVELEYWEHNRAADHEGIAAAWHDDFLGWPDTESRPIGKEEATSFLRRSYTTPDAFTFEIEPLGIRVLGEVAINHYAVHLTARDEDGDEKRSTLRITHTLILVGGKWKILGGMSSRA